MRALTLVAVAIVACRPPPSPAPSPEVQLRRRLGVPDDAQRVLILSQSSHLDIDWRHTFEDYYQLNVRDIFDQAAAALDADPRYAYSIAEMGYLERWLADRGPGPLAAHATSGRLRIVGGGLTSPDTLLTTEESLTRDALLGSLVAEKLGAQRPAAAWLPDSFGHSGTAPDVLSAFGYRAVGLSRLDGLRDGSVVKQFGVDPLAPGSTAAQLADAGSADFIWRGVGGAEVLAHFMPVRLYCQAELIDLDGLTSSGERFGTDTSNSPAFTNMKIASFISELDGWTKTPYLFVPIGCDFMAPRPLLPEYAKRWNDQRYASTHIYAVAATFEDFSTLVGFHKDGLPVVTGTIAPYWTGYFGSRPGVKVRARGAAEQLAAAEALLTAGGSDTATAQRLHDAWHQVGLANHHDFITGTSLDPVVADEQRPSLEAAWDAGVQLAAQAAHALAAKVDTSATGGALVVFNAAPLERTGVVELVDGGTLLAAGVPAYGWKSFTTVPTASVASVTSDGGTLTVSTGVLTATLTSSDGGWLLTSLRSQGAEALAGPSLEWVRQTDSGGLYRIGSEIPECPSSHFTPDQRGGAASVDVLEAGPFRVRLRATAMLGTQPLVLELSAEAGADRLRVTATGATPRGSTTLLRVVAAQPTATVRIGAAAGVTELPLSRLFDPTFWPAVRFAAHGNTVLTLSASTGVHAAADGALEWMVFRNANDEKPCTSLGADGTDDTTTVVTFELGAASGALDTALETARSIALSRPMLAIAEPAHGGALPATGRLLQLDGTGGLITAVKRADRGTGVVVHVLRPEAGARDVTLSPGTLTWSSASRPDLLERDDQALDLGAPIHLDAALTAVRLQP
jgi:hypothetical protein